MRPPSYPQTPYIRDQANYRTSLRYACPALSHATSLGALACRGQPEALRELFNRPDAQLVVFRGREGLVAPAEQPPAAAADAATAATPDSQATWQQPDLK